MALFQMKEYSVLTPVVSIDFQIELSIEQRMEWMRYSETLSRNVRLGCS